MLRKKVENDLAFEPCRHDITWLQKHFRKFRFYGMVTKLVDCTTLQGRIEAEGGEGNFISIRRRNQRFPLRLSRRFPLRIRQPTLQVLQKSS